MQQHLQEVIKDGEASDFVAMTIFAHMSKAGDSLGKASLQDKAGIAGSAIDVPPHPEHYFSPQAAAIADHYMALVIAAQAQNRTPPPFPEAQILPFLDNTWGDTGKAIFNNWLGLIYKVTDAKSLACHPASTTHRQLTEAEQKDASVTPDMIRLCVGIEHEDDLLADLEQALAVAMG